ncbi:MAG: tetraacyldisaccharide 4'-kinase [Cyclobacteriaceae bacterium]|nr:tetraacyldisaccharide 4'-kinase [Cyclobacteriaceae bacterium]
MMLLRLLLFPFAVLYDLVTRLRNHLYDIGYKKSFSFDTIVISVGNLSVGGSGKTPMVEYLLRLFKDEKVAVLSRGYRRRTRGFRLAGAGDNALTLGDEPFQMYRKFGDNACVAVGEERALAIPEILFHRPETQIILLDDAFQHRKVIPNLSILVTEFHRPFFKDYLMPYGRLREARNGAFRADLVIVSKCPDSLAPSEMDDYRQSIQTFAQNDIPVYFTRIKYGRIRHWSDQALDTPKHFYFFSGIGQPAPMAHYIRENFNLAAERHFPDHYIFSESEMMTIKKTFDNINLQSKGIITTEKDMVRIKSLPWSDKLREWPLYYLPIEIDFIGGSAAFDQYLKNALQNVNKPSN